MPEIHLIDRTLKSLRSQKAREEMAKDRVEYWDNDPKGFGVRISKDTGLTTFLFRYRKRGKRRRYKIGRYPALSLADAREKAREIRGQVAKGEDPAEERRQERAGRKNGLTVTEVATLFLEKRIEPNRAPTTHREYQRILLSKTGDVLPAWGTRKAEDITPEDAQDLLDSIAGRGSGIMANRTRAVLSSMFNWARGPGRAYVERSPMWGIEKPVERETKRKRVLSPEEIKALWNALEKESPKVRGALWLILLTGQRPTEVLTMEAEDLSRNWRWWTVPANKRKGTPESPLRVFLAPPAHDMLSSLKIPESGWIFSSHQSKAGHYSINSLDQAVAKRIRKRMESDRWTPHDLRRTCSTHMGDELGIPRHLRDRLVLGHSDPTPGAHYDWGDYKREIEEVFTRWGEWVSGLLKP